jgi:hypothetical protein
MLRSGRLLRGGQVLVDLCDRGGTLAGRAADALDRT